MKLIGISVDFENNRYFVRENYVSSISEFGASTVMLPYEIGSIQKYAEILDGVVLTGGGFDIHPMHYEADFVDHNIGVIKNERTAFELELINAMGQLQKPMLGICGGMQSLNVAYGGTLIQHLKNVEMHQQKIEPKHPVHKISTFGKLKEISKIDKTMVNSSHHQAVDKLGVGFFVNAISSDGVIEGIERNDFFCMGVQWHPEYNSSSIDNIILRSFINAC